MSLRALDELGASDLAHDPPVLRFRCTTVGVKRLSETRVFLLDHSAVADHGVLTLRSGPVAVPHFARLSMVQARSLMCVVSDELAFCKCLYRGGSIELQYYMPVPMVDFSAYEDGLQSLLARAMLSMDGAWKLLEGFVAVAVRWEDGGGAASAGPS